MKKLRSGRRAFLVRLQKIHIFGRHVEKQIILTIYVHGKRNTTRFIIPCRYFAMHYTTKYSIGDYETGL